MLGWSKAIAYTYLGDRCVRRNDFHTALKYLNDAIRLAPKNWMARCDRGVALQGLGDHRGAIDDFDKVITLKPRLTIAYFNRGVSQKFLGNFDRAFADLAQAVALSPRFADARAELGAVYSLNHDFGRAIASLTTAINLAPKQPDHFKHRGFAYFHRGDFEPAAADLRRSLDLRPDAYAMLFHYLARAKMGDPAALEPETLAGGLKDRGWPAALIDLYLGELTVDAALAQVADPHERAEAHFYIGEWHLLRGNRAEAVKALQTAALSCPAWFLEHTGATAELNRLGVACS